MRKPSAERLQLIDALVAAAKTQQIARVCKAFGHG
jgi:hypothetical protein